MAHAQAAPPPTYLHAIPSIYASHGDVPLVLGNMDLNRTIQAGAPIDPQNLLHAKLVAKGLRAMHGEFLLLLFEYF